MESDDIRREQIAEEWTRQTFGHDPQVVETIVDMLLDSWPVYERYTGPLGVGTLTDIIHVHFGPGIESSERQRLGPVASRQRARASAWIAPSATGTGFIGQYSPAVAAMFESLATAPDELLLFMHHVPYTHVLRIGKTVIQHIYDAHYQGAQDAVGFVARWRRLERLIDRERYAVGPRQARISGRARHRMARCHQQLVPVDIWHP